MDFGFLSESMGKLVRLERGGPDKLEGTLRSIMSDCLAIETRNEGVVYVQAHHIKTISEHVVNEVQTSVPEAANAEAPVAVEPRFPLVEAENFTELLNKLKHRLVRINHSGPNSLQGVLIDIHPDAITILHDMKDYVHYPIFHIKSIMRIYQTKRNEQPDKDNNKSAEGGKHSNAKSSIKPVKVWSAESPSLFVKTYKRKSGRQPNYICLRPDVAEYFVRRSSVKGRFAGSFGRP